MTLNVYVWLHSVYIKCHLPTSMHSNGPPLPPPPPPPATTLQFESPVTDFTPNLTSNITLTCSLNASRASDVTNSPTWSVLTTGSTVIGRRAAADDDVIKFLSSLVVMRNGKDHVASITEHTPASALMDLDNLKVKGQINGSSGFLELSWTYPSDTQAAEYTCESNGLNALGHYVTLKKTLELGEVTPSFTDLVNYVGDHQKTIADLKNTVHILNQTNKDQEQKISSQQQEIAALNATFTAQDKEISNLRNVQTGIIDCGDRHGYHGNLDNWHSVLHDAYKTKSVSFNQTYIRAPKVHLSFAFVDDFSEAYFRADLMSVSTTGFSMRCRGISTALPSYMMVNWISVPQ